VLPSQVLEYFIKKAKYHWIMNFCICRASMKCQNYPINLGCLFLGKAVLGINPELGRLVSKEEALEHIKKCSDAGLVHMIGRNRLDKQWLGVNPGNKLLSICNCDPCCCLWRVSPILNPKIGRKVHKMHGVKVYVTDQCIGCGTCTKNICFVNSISLINNRAKISKECRACGRCVDVCPQHAIKLEIDDNEFIEKSIKLIDQIIDVT
jgi:NAD-dependent dihydropyrimidine dehydrogenase PreA subunit